MQYPNNSHDRNTAPRPHFPTKLPQVQLEIVRGQAKNSIRPIQQRAYLFGSSDQCDLVLRDASIDEVQGYILNTPQGVWVRQLGRQTSLTVNGRPVRCMLLLNKDRVRVGPFEFRMHIQTPDVAPDVAVKASGTVSRTVSRTVDGPSPTAPLPGATPISSRWHETSMRTETPEKSVTSNGETRIDASHGMVPAPKFLRRATAISRGAQHTAVAPPSWKHMSQEILVD